ncbi:MAG: 6,7-dimethyl-8-ribityllumazine synthase [Candidatus Bipolaricaulis sp.]|nr:6,7-dimethyl-8-ribityllumazine synthase [Candidatus Bipolaricaulis sp.]MDD5220114.1 6,7-dimethyl-8-ribityllumazine synthase [Candidatus Bipolaricaulis sp.]MDD5646395.1 6,7-dimethyl-8-ribityllumazine synthase [Candidatus Bipolaricaulis sp.]
MGKTFAGKLDGKGLRVGIVVARFNDLITGRLLEGAVDRLRRSNVAEAAIDVCWVPGAFEVPRAAKDMAATGRYDGVIAIAAVIRGATPHFEYVANEITKGVARVGLDADIPVTFGVITADTVDQAIERAGTKAGNKGVQAAESLIEMVNVLRELK